MQGTGSFAPPYPFSSPFSRGTAGTAPIALATGSAKGRPLPSGNFPTIFTNVSLGTGGTQYMQQVPQSAGRAFYLEGPGTVESGLATTVITSTETHVFTTVKTKIVKEFCTMVNDSLS